MNSLSSHRSTSTEILSKRFRSWRRQYLHVVIYTSLFWIVVDAFFILLFSDCTKEIIVPCSLSSSTDKYSKISEPKAQLHPKIIIDKVKKDPEILINKRIAIETTTLPPLSPTTTTTVTTTIKVVKWWEVPPGATNPADWPGEGGRPVVIPDQLKEAAKQRFSENQFNIVASDLMALNRSVREQRSSRCLEHKFPPDLPSTSIIIVFHNEGNSTLLRTLASIILRSPIKYIKEIIMVDDASIGREYLKDRLEAFTKELPVPVHILRNADRLGLMKSRLRGADIATGDTLTFLDAHIECSPGWLEFLLYEVKKDRTAVVCPIIDVIGDNDFAYLTGSDMTWGGFNWRLNFRWYPVPQREEIRRNKDHSLPLLSPTMAGGLFTINREYFYEIGAYDPGMEVWGGENLEMSFRVWQCGGKVLIHPCSHVGHVFRKQTPYTFPGGTGNVIFHNNKRLVEVWLDKYKDFIYALMPELKRVEAGDVSERLALRERLKCKDFQWYLQNIYPESSMPVDFYHVGALKNELHGCVDSLGYNDDNGVDQDAGVLPCHAKGLSQIRTESMFCLNFHHVYGSPGANRTAGLNLQKCIDRIHSPVAATQQVLVYSKKGELRVDDLCMEGNANASVKLQKCFQGNQRQMWHYDNQTKYMKHDASGQCMTANKGKNAHQLSLAPCENGNNPSQRWYLEQPLLK